MVELLVVMMLGGMLFLAVFEGIQKLRVVSLRWMKYRGKESLSERYLRLEDLFQVRDSVWHYPEGFVFFDRSEKQETLVLKGNRCILCNASFRDTLFEEITRWEMKPSGARRVDSLLLWICVEEKNLMLLFEVGDFRARQRQTSIGTHEKQSEDDKYEEVL